MINVNEQNQVSARELQDALKIKSRFNDWIKRMFDYGFEEQKDYKAITQKKVTAQGNETSYNDYLLTLDTAKEIAMIQRTPQGKEIREYLVSLSNKKDDGELLTHPELISLIEIMRASGIADFRSIAKSKHIEKYIPENPKGKDYAIANIQRNTICGIDKKEIEIKLAQIGKKFKTIEKGIIQVDKYDLIRIAVIDVMLHFGKSETYAKNVANLAKTLAQTDKSIVFDRANTMYQIPIEYSKSLKMLS